jgi:hypothetical protein
VSVKLEHFWEREYVRTRLAEFKRRVRDLEDADACGMDRIQESVEQNGCNEKSRCVAKIDMAQTIESKVKITHNRGPGGSGLGR